MSMVEIQIRRLRNLGPTNLGGLATGKDVIILCPAYPGGNRAYGGQFIQKRAESYRRAGLSVSVVEVDIHRRKIQMDIVGGISVLRGNLQDAADYLAMENPAQIAAHQVERPLWHVIKPWADFIPVTIWIHGAEARHWRELASSYSAEEIVRLQPQLDRHNKIRKNTMTEIVTDRRIRKFVVSRFMESVVQSFTGTQMLNTEVIHNPILQCDFPYVEKQASQRHEILWIRSFNSFNYANDVCRDVILTLSERPDFGRFKITVQGDGRLFDDITAPLKKFHNVDIRKGFVSTDELRILHQQHGVILVPSRWDSQGLTCGEGMSSGLVPITTRVAALPEFVDETCGVLCPKDDVSAMARAIEALSKDPDMFLEKSANAARRAELQCGSDTTIVPEITWLKQAIK